MKLDCGICVMRGTSGTHENASICWNPKGEAAVRKNEEPLFFINF